MMRTTTSTSRRRVGPPTMRTGGFGGFGFGRIPMTRTTTVKSSRYNVPSNKKITFNASNVRQSSEYGGYPASNGLSGGSKFSHTKRGVGQWWEAEFDQQYYIDRVRIRNRVGCCGGRLGRTKVTVDN